jgi:hypothetical protein
VAIFDPRPIPRRGELRHHDGQGPSVDLTREPWGQPVWRWGLVVYLWGPVLDDNSPKA